MAAKSAKTEIIVNDRYKVVRVDSMNWQIFEYREIKDRAKAKRAGELDWIGLPYFFGDLKYALIRLLNLNVATSGESMTLDEAVSRIEAIERQIAKVAKKAGA